MTFDAQLALLFNNVTGLSPLLDEVIVFLASDLAYVLPIILLALVFSSQYSRREKWELLLVAFLSSIVARVGVAELIRSFYHRPRPFSVLPIHQLLTDTAWSFPSGHATFFFALATAVYLYNRKWGIGFFIAAGIMAVSRVIAGVHYPSDIIGGALIGILVALGIFYSVRRATPM